MPVSEIYINFHAESPDYEVMISEDGVTFETVFHEENGSAGKQNQQYIHLENKDARYIKYQQNKMWKHTGNGQYYGSSIVEMEAYSQSRLPESITIDQSDLTISKGRTSTLTYTIQPEGIQLNEEEILWESSNEDVAMVVDGEVRAVSEGTATITLQLAHTDLMSEIKVNVVDEKADYAIMRDRWKERLLASDKNVNDPDIKAYLDKISQESSKLWERLNKENDRTYLWERIPSDTVSADYTTQFTNIKMLTMGYYEPTSAIYHNLDVKNEIIRAIDFMIDEKKYNGSYWTGNWWDWQIGSPQPFVDTLILLHDDLLTDDYAKLEKFVGPIKGYASDPRKQWPSYNATGANLTDIAISVLGSAILLEDDSRIKLVQDSVPDVLKRVTTGDGLYLDGSLVQHTFFSYNGSYGNELLKGVGRIQSVLQGTDWEIVDDNINNLFNVVDKGYLQLMTNGKMPSMFSGRSISRAPGTNPFTSEFEAGKETLANLALIAKFAPNELKTKIQSHIKEWVQSSNGYFNFYRNPRDFEALIDLKNIVEYSNTVANEDKQTMNIYASMDRVFKKLPNYSIGISMYSNRIANYEFGNTENKHGWHTADGMFYLYNGDLAQFDEGYWTTVDPYRLPGITVDTKELADGFKPSVRSNRSWVGGSTNGELAAIGMDLDKSKEDMNLVAKKSWFLTNDGIINLGSGITGDTDATIETIIENRLIDKNEHSVTVDGSKFEGQKHAVNKWVNLNAKNVNDNIGYIIPNDAKNVEMYEENRVGKYTDINEYFVSDKEYTHDYVTIHAVHGKSVEDDTYEYMIVPGKNDEEIAKIAENVEYEVLQNTSNVQAIQTNDTIFANFWSDGEIAGVVKADQPVSAIIQSIGAGQLEISLSNPKQDNQMVSIELHEEISKVVQEADGITVEGNKVTLNSDQLAGASRTVVVQLVTDTSILEELVEKHSDKTAESYTASSWKVFNQALESAKLILEDETVSQEEVNQAITDLEEAIKALVEYEEALPVDKSALNQLVEEHSGKDANPYTVESWKVFNDALNEAKQVLSSDEVTQEEVDKAFKNLQAAISGLESVTTDPEIPVDPEEPSQPVDPENPVDPADLVDPENPSQPADPETPETENNHPDGSQQENGTELPKTATSLYNLLLIGFIIILLGAGIFLFNRRKEKSES